MRKIAIVLALIALGIVWAMLPAGAGDYGNYPTTSSPNDPCDEYHETRHPECQTTTTTEYETTTTITTSSTTQPEVTTTTSQETTTTRFVEQTTTTAAPCAPGLIHQPPFCVDPTTTTVVFDTTTTVAVDVEEQAEELPFTGMSVELLAGVGLLALVGGAGLKRLATR